MPDIQKKSQGTEPPPLPPNAAGQPMPRRTSPDKSVTLQHHQLARGASMKRDSSLRPQASSSQLPQISVNDGEREPLSTRRNSSDESHQTSQSDPRKWFDHSNENPTANYNQGMDVDPPFYQKETDSSNDDAARATYPQHLRPGALPTLQRTTSHSNSTNDYRSVIDDLTVEIQRLKEELKKYKQRGPGMLKKDKLFEIKVHGLPKRKKRELEATLRDFASGLSETPSGGEGSGRKTNSRHANRLYSGSGSMSKHVSSSSGSNPRPADSAYASMSTGNNSSGGSINRPGISRAKSSEQVENYLKDIPEGLYPHHMIMTDKEKKKLVVRRLEQLFTGEMSNLQRGQSSSGGQTLAPVMGEEPPAGGTQLVHQPPSLGVPEASREARIMAPDESGGSGKKSRSADYNSTLENSNGDQTDSGGNGTAVGEVNTSPPNAPLPEQRPTRPRDLDPNRAQNPSENMDYIRHLGLVPPELLLETKTQDVAPDADGWVYLNLLCNLAQLHIINVTPDFIRTAVSEKSAKFQLSPDGRKIRWRGGFEGTKFNSDSSGYTSQRSSMEEDTDGSNKDGQRKKLKIVQNKPMGQAGQKVQTDSGEEYTSAGSGKNLSKFGPQVTGSSESFHYKPLFLQQQSSSLEQTSLDETASSFAPAEGSCVGESRWGNSGSGTSQRKKRRLDGAIIYYSGAPFCTDLSGDSGDLSPATYMASSSQEVPQQMSAKSTGGFAKPDPPPRTESGSALKVRPLSDESSMLKMMEEEPEPCLPGSAIKSEDCDLELDFGWSNSPQALQVHSLEPCGLGGVMPDDHFMVVVSTKRQKDDQTRDMLEVHRLKSDEITDSVVQRLAAMSTSSPPPPATVRKPNGTALSVEIEYVSGRIKRLNPVPLPPPAIFFPPFSETDDTSVEDFTSSYENDEADDELGDVFTGRRADHQRLDNHYPDDEDMTSGDEEGEEPDGEDEPPSDTSSKQQKMHMSLPAQQPMRRTSSSAIAAPGTIRDRSKSMSAELPHSNTSNATIGDQESGYSSGGEE